MKIRTIQQPLLMRAATTLLLMVLMLAAAPLTAGATTETVSYIDASGTARTAQAVALDGTEESLGTNGQEKWYFVGTDIDHNGQINCYGDVHIILCDGYTMNIGGNNFGINGGDNSLTIYGQTLGTGTLNVSIPNTGDVAIYAIDAVTINGGTVNATGIASDGDVTINGGKVTSIHDPGILSNSGNIILGWTRTTDFIKASSYIYYKGTVKVADGMALTDGTNSYNGTLSAGDITAILEKTLLPCLALADNASNTAALIANSGKAIAVTLAGRTLYKDGKWNTLCLPFSLSAEQIAAHTDFAGATLMELDTDGKNGFDATNGALYLMFKSATAIAAGVPYLVKWNTEGDDFTSPVFSGVTIDATASTIVSDADDGLQEVQMVGTYSPVSVTADDKSILFLGGENTLYYSTVDRNIRPMRAYFSVPYIKEHAGTEAHSFTLSFDGETTGISLVPSQSPKGEGSDCWYTIDGRKLSGKPTQRRMYINKGKNVKVIIK